MGEWQFLDPASRGNLMEAWERESEGMFELAADPDRWEAPTGAGHWEVRDVIGHLVDTTETYFIGFDTARGEGEGPDNLGLRDMALNVNKGAQAFRDTPQSELLARLKDDRDQMMGIAADLTDDEWSEMLVPHKYMGQLPAPFYCSRSSITGSTAGTSGRAPGWPTPSTATPPTSWCRSPSSCGSRLQTPRPRPSPTPSASR